MLKSILEFFKTEKKYTFLTVVVAGIFLYLAFFPSNRMKDMANSPAVKQFQADEQKLQKQVKEKGSIQEYLKDHPDLSFHISLLSLIFGIGFLVGLVLDGFFIFKPSWRGGLQAHLPYLETTPWKFSMIFKIILLFIASSFLVGLVLALVRQFGGGQPEDTMNFYILLHTTLMDIICFLLIKKVITDAGGSWRELGFRLPEGKPWKEVFFAWGAYSAIMPVFAIVLMIILAIANFMHYEPPPHPLVNVFLEEEQRGKPLIVYSIILATVIGPIFEEIFFRGFCYNIIKRKFGVRWAMVGSSAFFALIHENSFAFWPIFVLGLILCYVYEKRGNLLAPMTLHVTHNLIFIYYFFVAKDLVSLVR